MKTTFYILFIVFLITASIRADDAKPQVGIEEKLGQNIPLDVTVYDEYGKPVTIGSLTGGRPFVLTLVYYRCPGICSPLLTGLAKTIDKSDLIPGKDYVVITVSFDPTENYITASEKKKNYFNLIKTKSLSNEDWRFLTADSTTISKLTESVGFRYIKKDNEYIHSAAIMVASPAGMVSRYLYGTDFLPFDFKLALIEASEGRTGSTISKVVSLCYSYDAEGKRYTLDFTRIAGTGVLFLLAVFVIVLIVKRKKK